MLQTTFSQNIISKGQVDIVDRLTRKEFYQEYVAKSRPLLIRGMTREWNALHWNADYFKARECNLKLLVKTGNVSEGKREAIPLSVYVEMVEAYEVALKKGLSTPKPGYLHDVPFFHLFPKFRKDIEPFPLELFPKWYWSNWHQYIQFFMGPTGSLTPLHFDTLCTNNLFFQVAGKKRFILVSAEQKDLCYLKGWRWATFNPDQPNFEKFPLAKKVRAMEVIVGPGDILYMPAGMLHQVHGLSQSISFNIDWHTGASAAKGMMTWLKGAPKQNVYYNFLSFLGLGLGIPSRYIFPFYKSYLNYIS